jgi:hypothetical protein
MRTTTFFGASLVGGPLAGLGLILVAAAAAGRLASVSLLAALLVLPFVASLVVGGRLERPAKERAIVAAAATALSLCLFVAFVAWSMHGGPLVG